MMSPQNIAVMEPIKLLTVKLQPQEDLGLVSSWEIGKYADPHCVDQDAPKFWGHQILQYILKSGLEQWDTFLFLMLMSPKSVGILRFTAMGLP